LTTGTAQANDTACGMVLCLGGRILGSSGGSECSSYEKKYFKIIVTKKGKFSPSRTAAKRNQELNKCPGADAGIVSKIGDRFGGVRGL
ncbi:TPA: killer protein, partial [Pseudomonas aeruginosa]|nr:killer protein [Pseudomonas aeruginosa]